MRFTDSIHWLLLAKHEELNRFLEPSMPFCFMFVGLVLFFYGLVVFKSGFEHAHWKVQLLWGIKEYRGKQARTLGLGYMALGLIAFLGGSGMLLHRSASDTPKQQASSPARNLLPQGPAHELRAPSLRHRSPASGQGNQTVAPRAISTGTASPTRAGAADRSGELRLPAAEIPIDVRFDPMVLAERSHYANAQSVQLRESDARSILVDPSGDVLVGLSVCISAPTPHRPQDIISICPILQSGLRRYYGMRIGPLKTEPRLLIGKPGYSVGGLFLHAGIDGSGVKVLFCRVEEDGLDTSDSHESAWIGCEPETDEDTVLQLLSDGEIIVDLKCDRYDYSQLRLGTLLIVHACTLPRPGETLGFAHGASFQDCGPKGSQLVGLQVSRTQGKPISSIQPLYSLNGQFVPGDIHGTVGPDKARTIAKPGYAITSIRVNPAFTGVQVAYSRTNGRTVESYSSEWLLDSLKSDTGIESQMSQIAGICGTIENDSITSLGFMLLPQAPR